jgi:hypothetical protein
MFKELVLCQIAQFVAHPYCENPKEAYRATEPPQF